MGYYASGSGQIRFYGVLSDEDQDKIAKILDDECFEYDFTTVGQNECRAQSYIDLWLDGKYYNVEEMLNKISQDFSVCEGEIAFCGEDNEHWRFVYDIQRNQWYEQNGHIAWSEEKTWI